MIKDPLGTIPKGPGQSPNDCMITDYKLSGSTATYTMTCKQPPMTAVGEMKFSGSDAYTGTLKMDMGGTEHDDRQRREADRRLSQVMPRPAQAIRDRL